MRGPGRHTVVNGKVSDIDDLLYSTVSLEPVTIVLSTAAEDANSPNGTTFLRRGLLLGKITASGLYKEFDSAALDGSEVSADVVVLGQNVDLSLISANQVAVTAYIQGTFKEGGIKGDLAGFTKADNQNIVIR